MPVYKTSCHSKIYKHSRQLSMNSNPEVEKMCEECKNVTGWLLVLFGVLFLLADLGVWNFWGIQWWTVGFLVAGAMMLSHSCCCHMDKKKK